MARASQTRRSRRLRRRIGALPLLAGILLASGLLRLGDGTGTAIATELATMKSADTAPAPAARDPDLAVLLEALEARETRIAAREAQLDERAGTLEEAERRIAEQLAMLETAEAELEQMLGRVESAAETDLGQLTAVYENMKPKEAAALFAQMDPAFAAGFLGRMRPDSAAPVLAGMPPEAAYQISVILAGRNASLPTE